MRWYIIFFVILFLLSGCSQQSNFISDNEQCADDLKTLQESNAELESRISELETENAEMEEQLDDYYFTQISSDIDLLDWTVEEIIRGMTLYNAEFANGGWMTYFYHQDTKNYYYQQGDVFPEDPFFQIRYKNSGQEFNISHLRIINIALGNRTLGQEEWTSYLNKVVRETQADVDLTCYQQTACREIKVLKCNKDNEKIYVWSEGTNLFMSRNDGGKALDTFERFYCTQ